MTDKEFCEIDTSFYGEEIDNIKQISLRTFNGEELKEYVEYCFTHQAEVAYWVKQSQDEEHNGSYHDIG